jgi:GNAT superfamily N-acetyltransferase
VKPETRCIEASAAEQRARDEATHAAWGGGLDVPQFLAREERLRATRFAKQSMRTWLLVEAGRTLTSLETFEVASRLGENVGRSFQIASVFTEPSLRGRGHASALLTEVIGRIAEGAQAITLYSDVGEGIYARAGFRALPAFDWCWPAGATSVPDVERADSEAAVVDVLAMKPRRGAYSLTNSAAQVEWHRERERIYAARLGAGAIRHGVLRTDGGAALLAGDVRRRQLCVLDWWATTADAAHRLARAAADEAAHAELREVMAWAAPFGDEPPLLEGLARVAAQRVPRHGALPMLRGPEPSSWRDVPRVEWV